MFTVVYTLHVTFDGGDTSFNRGEQIPFAPFIGLDILDDAVGEFKIEHVAWASDCRMFCCQATCHFRKLKLQEVTKLLRAAGWKEVKEVREMFEVRDRTEKWPAA